VNNGAWVDTVHVHTPDGAGELIASSGSGSATQYFADGLGSVRVAQTAGGSHGYSFDAFGIELGQSEGIPANAPQAEELSHRYTGEYTDRHTGLIYLRAQDYDPKVGRFISMDEHPGSQRIPLTLNKYLYGNADPVNTIDPSGNFGLGSVSMGGVSSTLSSISISSVSRGALNIARKSKIYDIYDYATWPLHFYMFAENKMTKSGFRYDVGNDVGWGGMKNHKPWAVIPGGYVSARVAQRNHLKGKRVKVASHSFGQWLTWHVSVVNSEQEEITCELNYSLNPFKGTNCLSWTIMGTAKAIAISKLPI